jgi:hypothetical protein
MGEKITEDSDTSSCFPVVYNKDLKITTKSVNEDDLNPDEIAHPCGIAARSFFNDTFTMFKPDGAEVTISSTGIAWEDDKTYR